MHENFWKVSLHQQNSSTALNNRQTQNGKNIPYTMAISIKGNYAAYVAFLLLLKMCTKIWKKNQ